VNARVFNFELEDEKLQRNDGPSVAPDALDWIDMSNWDNEPLPERKWAIRDCVPLHQAGLLSGEGGTGKSILELTKNVAHVTGKEWLGLLPEPGPTIYVGAEDSKDEIHIRLAAIAKHYGASFKELVDGGLHILCLLGEDATLVAANGKGGTVETTKLYQQLYEAAGDIKPKNISIDTLSRAFAGDDQSCAGLRLRQPHAGTRKGRRRRRYHTEPSQRRGDEQWHRPFRVDGVARRLPFQAVPHKHQGRVWRATGRRSSAARVQEEPIWSARRDRRGSLREGSVPS
jgi:hypothetical protein